MQFKLVTPDHLSRINAYVAEQAVVKGDLTAQESCSQGGLRIDGRVDGSIRMPAGGLLHIGPTGHVVGEAVEADYVIVEGHVNSTILARKAIEMTSSSTIKGEVRYQKAIHTHDFVKLNAGVNYVGEAA